MWVGLLAQLNDTFGSPSGCVEKEALRILLHVQPFMALVMLFFLCIGHCQSVIVGWDDILDVRTFGSPSGYVDKGDTPSESHDWNDQAGDISSLTV